MLKFNLKVFIILYNIINIKYFCFYIILIILLRELLIFFSTQSLHYNLVTDAFFILDNFTFKYEVNKKEILLELKSLYIPRIRKLSRIKDIPYGSLVFLFYKPFHSLYSRFSKGE